MSECDCYSLVELLRLDNGLNIERCATYELKENVLVSLLLTSQKDVLVSLVQPKDERGTQDHHQHAGVQSGRNAQTSDDDEKFQFNLYKIQWFSNEQFKGAAVLFSPHGDYGLVISNNYNIFRISIRQILPHLNYPAGPKGVGRPTHASAGLHIQTIGHHQHSHRREFVAPPFTNQTSSDVIHKVTSMGLPGSPFNSTNSTIGGHHHRSGPEEPLTKQIFIGPQDCVWGTPVCGVWWQSQEGHQFVTLGSQTGRLLTCNITTAGKLVGETCVPGPIVDLQLMTDAPMDTLYLIIHSRREYYRLVLEVRSSGYVWPGAESPTAFVWNPNSSSSSSGGINIPGHHHKQGNGSGSDSTDSNSFTPPDLFECRSRLASLKQMSVDKIASIKNRITEGRKLFRSRTESEHLVITPHPTGIIEEMDENGILHVETFSNTSAQVPSFDAIPEETSLGAHQKVKDANLNLPTSYMTLCSPAKSVLQFYNCQLEPITSPTSSTPTQVCLPFLCRAGRVNSLTHAGRVLLLSIEPSDSVSQIRSRPKLLLTSCLLTCEDAVAASAHNNSSQNPNKESRQQGAAKANQSPTRNVVLQNFTLEDGERVLSVSRLKPLSRSSSIASAVGAKQQVGRAEFREGSTGQQQRSASASRAEHAGQISPRSEMTRRPAVQSTTRRQKRSRSSHSGSDTSGSTLSSTSTSSSSQSSGSSISSSSTLSSSSSNSSSASGSSSGQSSVASNPRTSFKQLSEVASSVPSGFGGSQKNVSPEEQFRDNLEARIGVLKESTSMNLVTFVIVTNFRVCQLIAERNPVDVCLNGAVKNCKEYSRVLGSFQLNSDEVLELAGDLALLSPDVTTALHLYKQAGTSCLKMALKLATHGNMHELLVYIQYLFAMRNLEANHTELIHLSNLAVMAFIQQLNQAEAESLSDSSMVSTTLSCSKLETKFVDFLKINRYFDETLVVRQAVENSCWTLLAKLTVIFRLETKIVDCLAACMDGWRLLRGSGLKLNLGLNHPVRIKQLQDLLLNQNIISSLVENWSGLLRIVQLMEVVFLDLTDKNGKESNTTEDSAKQHLQLLAERCDPDQPGLMHVMGAIRDYEKNLKGMPSSQSKVAKSPGKTGHKSRDSNVTNADSSEEDSGVLARDCRAYLARHILQLYLRTLLKLLHMGDKENVGKQIIMNRTLKSTLENDEAPQFVDEDPIKVEERYLATGRSHCLLLQPSGNLTSWGGNDRGCTGLPPTNAPYHSPANITVFRSLGIKVAQVTCGHSHSMVLTDHGVFSWGSNNLGQLGIGETCVRSSGPVRLDLDNIVSVAAGQYHSLALNQCGTVLSWGWGVHGQLGNNSVRDQFLPQPIRALRRRRVVQIAAGFAHTLVLVRQRKIGGKVFAPNQNGACGQEDDNWGNVVYSFGLGLFGQLGHGHNNKAGLPVRVLLPPLVVRKISSGYFHNLAVAGTGQVWQWGSHPQVLRIEAQQRKKDRQMEQKQLQEAADRRAAAAADAILSADAQQLNLASQSQSSESARSDAEPMGDQSNFKRPNDQNISEFQSVDKNGTAADVSPPFDQPQPSTIGNQSQSSFDSLRPDIEPMADRHLIPQIIVDDLGDIQDVGCGSQHSVLLTKAGLVYTWGRSVDGQLGLGSRAPARTPQFVQALHNETIRLVSAGSDYTVCLSDSGTLFGWGGNSCGQLGRPPVEADHTAADQTKFLMTKTTKRIIRLHHGLQNSCDRPKPIPMPSRTGVYSDESHKNPSLMSTSQFYPKTGNFFSTSHSINVLRTMEKYSKILDLGVILRTAKETGNLVVASRCAFLLGKYLQAFDLIIQAWSAGEPDNDTDSASVAAERLISTYQGLTVLHQMASDSNHSICDKTVESIGSADSGPKHQPPPHSQSQSSLDKDDIQSSSSSDDEDPQSRLPSTVELFLIQKFLYHATAAVRSKDAVQVQQLLFNRLLHYWKKHNISLVRLENLLISLCESQSTEVSDRIVEILVGVLFTTTEQLIGAERNVAGARDTKSVADGNSNAATEVPSANVSSAAAVCDLFTPGFSFWITHQFIEAQSGNSETSGLYKSLGGGEGQASSGLKLRNILNSLARTRVNCQPLFSPPTDFDSDTSPWSRLQHHNADDR